MGNDLTTSNATRPLALYDAPVTAIVRAFAVGNQLRESDFQRSYIGKNANMLPMARTRRDKWLVRSMK
jgi:hypothetical protein